MEQEGNKIKFATNGIERATSNYNASKGGCNEIIGMIYRDGSLVPYESVNTNIPVYIEPTIPTTRFDKMWVHKTTKQNNYIVFQLLSGKYRILWKSEANVIANTGSWVVIANNIPTTITKVDFVGNMVVVNGIAYLFRDGVYSQGLDTNDIQFRMNLGAQGNGVAVMYDGVKFSYSDNTTHAANKSLLYQKTFGDDKTYEQINADFKYLEAEVKKGDYISGACFLRYAIKLYDGSYVGVSKPVLFTPDTYYKDILGETYSNILGTTEKYSYNSNPLKFAIKTSNETTGVVDGLRLKPQLGLIQAFFGSTMFWNWIQLYDKGHYVSTISQIVDIINGAINNNNGNITDSDSQVINILNLFLRRLNSDGTTYDNFQPVDLDYWLLSKGRVGFREIFQFNSGSFDKKKYYKYNQSATIGSRLNYFDLTSGNDSIHSFERVKGWTWGAIPYFVPRLYDNDNQQNAIYNTSNLAMMIAAMLNPYKAGHDNTVNGANYATILSLLGKSSNRNPWRGKAPIVTPDGLDDTPSWFTTRYKDLDISSVQSAEDLYVGFGSNAVTHAPFSEGKGAVFAPLNEHIGELGFGVFNKECFEGEDESAQNNVSMVFGRECYTPVYEMLNIPNLPNGLVSSIDIFMTTPVSIHEDYKTDSIRFDTMPAHRPYRKQKEVVEDLNKSIGQFHRIHSIPIEEIISYGAGNSYVVEHPIGKIMMPYIERGSIANIEQQPLLEWSGNNKNDYKVSYVYNNKLHIAQITEEFNKELYKDCNDDISLNNNARSQIINEPYTISTNSQKDVAYRIGACLSHKSTYEANLIAALNRTTPSITFSSVPTIRLVYLLEIMIDNVSTTIVLKKRVNVNRLYPQNIGFFYPSSDAKKVQLIGFETEHTSGSTTTHYFYEIPTITFNLEQDKDNMIAYNFDLSSVYDYLTIGTNGKIATYTAYDNEANFPYKKYESNNTYVRDLNIFKVSETNQPLVFPYANTYRVGYGKIIAFSSYTTALSQGQFGEYPLLVFTTEGIFTMRVDTSGIGSYVSNAPLSREVCTNPNTIVQVDGGVFFGTAKGLMFISGDNVKKWSEQINGEPKNLPNSSAIYTTGDGLVVYNNAITNANLVQLSGAISQEDFVDYINLADTCISYLYELNKLLVYNKTKDYSYMIDIDEEGKCTKLGKRYYYDNSDYPASLVSDGTTLRKFTLDGDTTACVDCLIQTRPILLDTDMPKSQFRVVLRGIFNNYANILGRKAGLYVLGSIDGEKWMFIGGSEYSHISQNTNDIGTTIERLSIKYIMVIYASKNNVVDTKIDNIEISSNEKYNDKTR